MLLAVLSVLAVGCEQDSDNQNSKHEQGPTLQVIPMTSSFLQVEPWTTRSGSLPAGYVSYHEMYPSTTPNYATIGVFMTPVSTSSIGKFIYQGLDEVTGLPTDDWESNIRIDEGQQYYMYGFMPHEDSDRATLSMLPGSTDYADGAVLTLNNFNTLTAADVCAIVGIRKGLVDENDPTQTESKITGLLADVKLGNFGYLGGPAGTNTVFVLLKHIYSGLHFKFHMDAGYAALRTIKLTKVELEAENIPAAINVVLTFRANDEGLDPLTVEFPDEQPQTNTSIQLFPYTGSASEIEVPVSPSVSLLGCFAPSRCNSFKLKTHYNVYDRKGNLIRSDCYAENRVDSYLLPSLSTIQAGQIYTVDFLVKPTYLYVLSEPDLDNPTIELSSN